MVISGGSGSGEGMRAQLFITLLLLEMTHIPREATGKTEDRELSSEAGFGASDQVSAAVPGFPLLPMGSCDINAISLNHLCTLVPRHYGDGVVINDGRPIPTLAPLSVASPPSA